MQEKARTDLWGKDTNGLDRLTELAFRIKNAGGLFDVSFHRAGIRDIYIQTKRMRGYGHAYSRLWSSLLRLFLIRWYA